METRNLVPVCLKSVIIPIRCSFFLGGRGGGGGGRGDGGDPAETSHFLYPSHEYYLLPTWEIFARPIPVM